MYHVQQFAELAGVTVRALHYYDRVGLLKPRRTDAGHRVYALRDLERLEQIVALKLIGLSLKQIKSVLDRDTRPLVDVLRLQRRVLEEQRRVLDRAIGAIQHAERDMEAGALPGATVLKTLIEVIGMNDELDVMKKYYGDEAWARWRHHYEQWPSQEWQELYRDVQTSLEEDPASDHAQSLAARWLALAQADWRSTGGDPAICAGLIKAWADRQHWPAALQQRMARFNVDAITNFISEAAEVTRRAARQKQGGVPDRASESRIALFREFEAALGEEPAGARARALVTRWNALMEEETGGDPDTISSMRSVWSGRRSWPTGHRRWIASLYAMDLERWETVADFVDQAMAATSPFKDVLHWTGRPGLRNVP